MAEQQSKISPALATALREALAMTDRLAFANVTHDNEGHSILDAQGQPIKGRFVRGGPFGAALAVSVGDKLEIIGEPRGNNVVGSGIASRHAEDQALQPDNYAALATRLSQLNAAGHNPSVWVVSSGQSCPNCHTKQEIMARDLVGKNLIQPGQFKTLYGATFDETFRIAQFNDAEYADAMVFASRQPKHPGNLIRQQSAAFSAVPDGVRAILRDATAPTAVLVRQGEVYAVGSEARSANDPYATAEVNAVRAACLRNRQEGAFASWGVDGTLYTTSRQVGPLLFAEAGWTKIDAVVAVKLPPELSHKQFDTQEVPGLRNADFLKIVAGGYQHPQAAIGVVRDTGFVNTAQPQWERMLQVNSEQLYNGANVSPAVEQMRDSYTRYRFAAEDMCNCVAGQPHRPLQPLLTLAASKKFGA